MEMLKKIMILLAITGSCTLEAAMSAMASGDDEVVGYTVDSINRAAQELLEDFEETSGKRERFVSKTHAKMRTVNENINSLIKDSFNQELLKMYPGDCRSVKLYLSYALQLTKELRVSLMPDEKNVNFWGMRSKENISVINEKLKKLNASYEAIKHILDESLECAKKERKRNYQMGLQALKDDFTGRSTQVELPNPPTARELRARDFQKRAQAGHAKWCEDGNDPDKYW